MFVGLLATAISSIIGVTVGLTAGYYRGRVDDVLMRSADVMLALPSLVFAIALIGLFGTQSVAIPDPFVYFSIVSDRPDSIVLPGTVMIVIGLVNWVWFARVARGEALSIAQKEYVKSATTLGGSNFHILRAHVLPNSITPILVFATIQVAFVILLESGLSFLGFTGTTLSWGFDIAQGRAHLAGAWWISTVPGIAIMLAVFGVNLVGDWLRDSLDPELNRGEAA
jgi:peptide/nickel transport system permease protein